MGTARNSDIAQMKVAVIIPCLNEAAAIAKVVRECRRHLPAASVFVLDNGSEDETAAQAVQAGAEVIHSPLRGKGNVIRHAFRVIDADYFVMIDGDGTYPVQEAARLINLAAEYNYEMVIGSRLKLGKAEAFRPLHFLGNRLFTNLVRILFGFQVEDLLSGYRVFSRRFAAEVNLISRGFEIETELTIRAMAQNLAFCEVPIPYGERVEGGKSKLRTFRDGWKILLTIVRFLAYFRPMLFFTVLTAVCLAAGWYVESEALTMPLLVMAPLFLALAFYLDFHVHHEQFRRAQSGGTGGSGGKVSDLSTTSGRRRDSA